MTSNEILELGFKFDRVKYCCGGQKNELYRKGEYELRIRPKAEIYQLRFRGNGITSFLKLSTLKAKLYELEILEKETQN